MTIDRSNWRWETRLEDKPQCSVFSLTVIEDGIKFNTQRMLSHLYAQYMRQPMDMLSALFASMTADMELTIVQRRMRNRR